MLLRFLFLVLSRLSFLSLGTRHATPRNVIIPLVRDITRLRFLSFARRERNDTLRYNNVSARPPNNRAPVNFIYRLNEDRVQN